MLAPKWIERPRRLAYCGQVLVDVGDWVSEQQLVARIDYIPGAMHRVDVARPLRISGQHIRRHLLVREGDMVQAGQILAANTCFGERRVVVAPCGGLLNLVSRSLGYVYIREPIPVGKRETITLNVAEQLQVSPLLVNDRLRVTVGQAVVPDQVIARRRSSWREMVVLASVYGRVTAISNGQVTLQPLYVQTDLPAYLAGRVTAVQPGWGASIRSHAWVIPGKYGLGGETGGEIKMVSAPGEDLSAGDVQADWQGKVVVSGGSADIAVLHLAAAAGARALVLASLPMSTVLELGQSRLVGLTGEEVVPFTLVLTEGFLPVPMAQRTWSTLVHLQGRYASVNGTTHIRAGVVRPEVVVSERTGPHAEAGAEVQVDRLSIGAQVRVISGLEAGQVGTVTELPLERQPLATGSLALVAVVRLAGRHVRIPLGNLQPWNE